VRGRTKKCPATQGKSQQVIKVDKKNIFAATQNLEDIRMSDFTTDLDSRTELGIYFEC
jgi:hypothetical protein